MRLVIRDVTLTTVPESRRAEFVIWWRGEVTTQHRVTCPPIGWHCVTAEQLLQRIRQLAPTHPDHRIAELLNAEDLVTQTGKSWTYQRVFSIRKQHDIPTGCPIDTSQDTPRGDGLVSVKTAATMLNVSTSTIHLWAKQGVLQDDQRVQLSKRWVKVDDEDLARLNGSCTAEHLPSFADIMKQRQIARDELWSLVRHGRYTAYRVSVGNQWAWHLEPAHASEAVTVAPPV